MQKKRADRKKHPARVKKPQKATADLRSARFVGLMDALCSFGGRCSSRSSTGVNTPNLTAQIKAQSAS